MSVVKGVVEAKSNKYDKYSILVNGNWYSSKYEIRAEKGDTVEFDDGGDGKKYARKVRVVSEAGSGESTSSNSGNSRTPGFPVGVDTKDRSIVRQNSLSHAVQMVIGMTIPAPYDSWEEREEATKLFATLIVETARIFEDYSSGDGDAAAAEAILKE